MKFSHVVPFAALGMAIVFPPEQVLSELTIEDHHAPQWANKANAIKDEVVSRVEETIEDSSEKLRSAWQRLADSSRHVYDEASEYVEEQFGNVEDRVEEYTREFSEWLENEGSFEALAEHPHHPPPPPHHPPGHGPPEHGPPGHGPPGHGPPGHGPPGHGPPDHHPPHHPEHPHKPNLTVYQLIAGSKYTTKLAELINDYPDLVETLNSTKANVTLFAPTNKAFEKIPEHAPKPSKEQILHILQYHTISGFYPAGRVLATYTAPTLLIGKHLGGDGQLQRVAFKLTLRGLTVNSYSRVIAPNIFGTNGVIHGVDSIIVPPPRALTILDFLPSYFSTLELGLSKTGLYETLNKSSTPGTFFAPNNFAFQKLGPKANAFLFSRWGEKYLKALLEYHIVPNHILYSDAYYEGKAEAATTDVDAENFPHGRFHADLPTLLKDRSLSVDIARFGGWVTIKINGYSTVAIQDIVADDGVIQIVRNVLIPPKKLGGGQEQGQDEVEWDGGEITVEDLKERLESYVTKGKKVDL